MIRVASPCSAKCNKAAIRRAKPSTVFNKAIEYGSWDKTNPALGIKKFKEKSRDRFLQADELPRFFQAVTEEPTCLDSFLDGTTNVRLYSLSSSFKHSTMIAPGNFKISAGYRKLLKRLVGRDSLELSTR
jgi:hypothetical protein